MREITCPACHKPNQTQPCCARCGCDLSPLLRVLEAASAVLAGSKDCLRAADWTGALNLAQRSWSLVHSREAARLAFLATAAMGQSLSAYEWHARASAPVI